MIYSFTANLAIDLFIETNKLRANSVNRTNYFDLSANGKGVNFSIILKHLGVDSIVTGYKAGFTGNFIDEEINKIGLKTYFPEVDGITRINVFTKVIEEGVEYTQVNPGPSITDEAKNNYLNYLNNNLTKGDILSINGSFPKGIDREYISKICEVVKSKEAELIIDNSSDIILDLCKYQPFIIKPNEEELCSWFGVDVDNYDQFIELSKKLLEMGVKNVLLSLGSSGAMLINHEKILYCNAPKGQVVNTAMAGDTLLATFVGEKILGSDDKLALRKSVAAGSSTAFREGLTDFNDVDVLMEEIIVKEL